VKLHVCAREASHDTFAETLVVKLKLVGCRPKGQNKINEYQKEVLKHGKCAENKEEIHKLEQQRRTPTK